MERVPPNIENPQFLQDPFHGFLGKSNGTDGPAQWVYGTAKDNPNA